MCRVYVWRISNQVKIFNFRFFLFCSFLVELFWQRLAGHTGVVVQR